eukprot:1909333-Rhodomonas_salina.1
MLFPLKSRRTSALHSFSTPTSLPAPSLPKPFLRYRSSASALPSLKAPASLLSSTETWERV